jgi:hypothetical protein
MDKLRAITSCALAASLLLAAPPLRAQLSGVLGSGQGLGGLGALPSVTQAGPANVAGVLQYCIQNNYLSEGVAGAAKNALLGQTPGSAQSSGFMMGSKGFLETGNGKSFNLSSAGSELKSQMSHKVCDMVLQHAKSLI